MKMLTLEAGKYYKTREGEKAFVAFVRQDKCNACHQAIGHIVDGDFKAWRKDGGYMQSNMASNCDIIEEWKEPEVISVRVYLGNDGKIYADRQGQIRIDNPVASTIATLTEGTFE